jgi:hypothetical protein
MSLSFHFLDLTSRVTSSLRLFLLMAVTNLPWVGVHTSYFSVLHLVSGFDPLYWEKVLEMILSRRHASQRTKTLFVVREVLVVKFETIVNYLLSKSLHCNDGYNAGCSLTYLTSENRWLAFRSGEGGVWQSPAYYYTTESTPVTKHKIYLKS